MDEEARDNRLVGGLSAAFVRARAEDRDRVLEQVHEPDADARGTHERVQAAPRYRYHHCRIISGSAPRLVPRAHLGLAKGKTALFLVWYPRGRSCSRKCRWLTRHIERRTLV